MDEAAVSSETTPSSEMKSMLRTTEVGRRLEGRRQQRLFRSVLPQIRWYAEL